jgi:hypothetical protein
MAMNMQWTRRLRAIGRPSPALLLLVLASIGVACACVPSQLPSPSIALPLPVLGENWSEMGTGAVLGTAADSATQLPLGGAQVWIRPSALPDVSSSNDGHALVFPLGGFLFERLPPGEHTLFVRITGWRLCAVPVTVRQGVVDTLRLILAQPREIYIAGPSPAYPISYCLRRSESGRSPGR